MGDGGSSRRYGFPWGMCCSLEATDIRSAAEEGTPVSQRDTPFPECRFRFRGNDEGG